MFSPLSSVVQLAVLLGRVIHHENVPEHKCIDDAIYYISYNLSESFLNYCRSDSLHSSLSNYQTLCLFYRQLLVCRSVCLTFCVADCLVLCLSDSLSNSPSVSLPVFLSIYLSVCCLSFSLSILVLFTFSLEAQEINLISELKCDHVCVCVLNW